MEEFETFEIYCAKCKETVRLRSWIDSECPKCGHTGSYPTMIEIIDPNHPLCVQFEWDTVLPKKLAKMMKITGGKL